MKRSRALWLAIGAAALSARPPAALAQASASLRLGTLPYENAAEPYFARDLGYFTKAGLDVSIQEMTNTPTIIAAMVAGSLDIGYTTIDTLSSIHAHNVPVVVIAPSCDYIYPTTQKTAGILVNPNSAIRTAKDLNGKTFGMASLNSLGSTLASAWIDQNGGDSRTVKWVEVSIAAMSTALEQGRVDAILIGPPFLAEAEKRNRVIMEGYNAIGKHFIANVWTAQTSWAKEHADIVHRFAAVIHQTAVWANAHHDESAEILAKYTKIPLSTLMTMARSHYAEELSPRLMQPGIDVSAKYNGFTSFPAAELLF